MNLFQVTKRELAKHNKIDDAWTAIRGRVYNITEYFSFHPGGEEELMRGAGIDATTIFDEVFSFSGCASWIFQKHLIGSSLGKLRTNTAEMLHRQIGLSKSKYRH